MSTTVVVKLDTQELTVKQTLMNAVLIPVKMEEHVMMILMNTVVVVFQDTQETHCENIDECVSDPCENGATCQDEENQYSCLCAGGYTGTHCETDIDECSSDPCENGATCQDEVNQYSCLCVPGYTGTHCETDIDECSSDPCENGATCQDEVNQYSCLCAGGYTGTHCETEIDECSF